MEIGTARVDITPDLNGTSDPLYLTGFVRREGPARGVLHPIAARAMVVQCDGRLMALVSLEVLELTPEHATALRSRIGEVLGIGTEAVGVCCTHSHYAPALIRLRECGEPSEAYARWLDDRVIECVRLAAERIAPAKLVVGEGELNIGRNRRAHQRGDHGGIDGASPRDGAVRVLAAVNAAGDVLGMLFHYACHMVSLPPEDNRISGDLAGVAATLLEKNIVNDGAALFLTGCSGDINPRDEFKGAVSRTETAGRLMADAVTAALGVARPVEVSGGIDAVAREVGLPTAGVDPDWERQLEEVKAALAAPGFDPGGLDARILRAKRDFLSHRIAEAARGYPSQVTSRVQRLDFGEVTLLLFSDEVFYEIGQAAAGGKAGESLWPVGYANGGRGYICTAAGHREGGYEPVESNWFYDRPPLAESSSEVLVAAGQAILSPKQA